MAKQPSKPSQPPRGKVTPIISDNPGKGYGGYTPEGGGGVGGGAGRGRGGGGPAGGFRPQRQARPKAKR